MFHRLRTDFQLSIITLLGACAVFGILPFAAFRFLEGNFVTGLVDASITFCIISTVVYAWRTGDTLRAGIVLALVASGGSVAIAILLGNNGLFWMYPVFLTSFFLVNPRLAVAINTSTAIGLAWNGEAFDSTEHMASFLTTCIVVSVCAFIFAQRTETQRVQLEKLATRDPLTGAKNRRAMEQELRFAVTHFEQTGTTYGLVMLDLDYFKQINDQFGHHIGDQVLIEVANLIIVCTRRADHLFRFGGEEFVLLLSGADRAGMMSVANNLRHRIETELQSPCGTVTASLGAAILSAGEDWPSWLARADAALYIAKNGGRNQVIIDDSVPPHS